MQSQSATPESDHWYLATSKPRQEFRAVENLENQSITAQCPQLQVEKIRAGKKRIVSEPLFTGYIFIKLSPEDPNWHKVRSTRGIRDWVRFAGNPAKLPSQLVEQLVEMTTGDNAPPVVKAFKQGDSIRVLDGPFKGLNGIFDCEDGENRAMILIEFLGKTNRIKLENQSIAPS